MLELNDGRNELWQWDTGRTLAVDADCSQVHFSNKVFGRSIDVEVVAGTAVIPDILLQTEKELNVWAFVGTAENGYTKISKTFKVNRRNKPADYVFTPPDQTSLEEIKEKIDYLESIQDPDAIKNAVGDYLEKNPVKAPVQSVNGKTGTVELTAEDVGAISDETDPTVPAWAKQPVKPTYTASEVGALPDTYTPPNQTAQQVGADPAGTAASAVSQHNTDTAAHNDLRLTLQELANRINAALDSDDTTLDQMSEVVAYIKSNKTLIDAITTSKVSVADIVNDLVTNVAGKPLSAAQGVALKSLIDELRTLIPEAYTLPVATETALGGVKPVTATEDMTQPVGVDAEGRLMTQPGSVGSGIAVSGATVGQTVKISAVDENGVPTAWEAVDFPSWGVWELLEDVDITEETAIIQVTNLKPTYTEILCIVDDLIAATNNYEATVWANGVQINSRAIKTFKDSDNSNYRSNNWCRCVLYGGYCVCYCATDVGNNISAQNCKVSRGATYIGNFETFEIRAAHQTANFASGKIKIYAR